MNLQEIEQIFREPDKELPGSRKEIREWLWQASKEIGFDINDNFDYFRCRFFTERALSDIQKEYGKLIPIYLMAVWINEHQEETAFDKKTVNLAKDFVCYIKSMPGDKYSLFESVTFSIVHQPILNELFLRLTDMDLLQDKKEAVS